MNISDNGIKFIEQQEGFIDHVVPDGPGKEQIGYGHDLLPGETFTTITQQQAHTLLTQKDLISRIKCVNDNVKIPLTQNQFDALVDFVYNLGCQAFLSSSLLRYLNGSQYELAANEFDKWVYTNIDIGGLITKQKSQGLINRRAAEKKLFLS